MMATITASPPATSPPPTSMSKSPTLPALVTSSQTRRTSANRPSSFAQHRMSSYSSTSRSNTQSRPLSQVFPAFHSSLSYTLVRDFAYPSNHPFHYGPQPDVSGTETPASESRRLSDPQISSWEDSRGSWSAGPPWIPESNYPSSTRDQLPAMTFNDGGPPYEEDEDLQSPVVTTSKHKKSRLGERGRSPGAAGPYRGIILNSNGDQVEEYHPTESEELDGPGGEIETYPNPRLTKKARHRDSNFAKPLQRNLSPHDHREPTSEEEEQSDDEGRYSKDYSFTIASPDEEMHGKAVALFDFVPEHENELALSEGQIILVSYRHGQGWLVAEDPQTQESGLVPEEFVRLVRHIEGGLNGLNAVNLDERINEEITSPISNETSSTETPRPPSNEFSGHNSKTSNGSNSGEKHPAVQSNFSTSSRDFSPLKKDET